MRWLALLLLLLATPALADEIVMLAGPDGAMLQTRLCRPAQSGPAPLVIMNHGAMPRAEVRPHLQPLPCDAEPARWFTARGHVVAAEGAEQFGASTQRLDQGKAVDAASAAVSLAGLVESDNDGWSVEFPAES